MNFHPRSLDRDEIRATDARFSRAREIRVVKQRFSSYYCACYTGNSECLGAPPRRARARARTLSRLMAVIVLRLLSYSMLGILILECCVARKRAEAVYPGGMLTRINASTSITATDVVAKYANSRDFPPRNFAFECALQFSRGG